jgi:hypothetical protein
LAKLSKIKALGEQIDKVLTIIREKKREEIAKNPLSIETKEKKDTKE